MNVWELEVDKLRRLFQSASNVSIGRCRASRTCTFRPAKDADVDRSGLGKAVTHEHCFKEGEIFARRSYLDARKQQEPCL
jgi:hypothetical protein